MAAPNGLTRRALPFVTLAALTGRGSAETTALAVTCDPTLAPGLRKAAAAYRARSGAQAFIFATGPGLILPQLARNIQNDIVVTEVALLDQAAQAGIIAAPVPAQWRDPLVIAGLQGVTALDETFAAPDPTPASDIDGPAIVARLGLRPARVLGAADTDEVAFLLTTGAAQAGLLHMTDVRADERLSVIRVLPAEAQAPLLFAASVTRLAGRPDPQGFVAFLAGKEAAGILGAAGLETIG